MGDHDVNLPAQIQAGACQSSVEVLVVARRGHRGPDIPLPANSKNLLRAGKYPEVFFASYGKELLFLHCAQRVTQALLHGRTEHRGDQLVPALSYLRYDALLRNIEPKPLERPAPGLDMRRVGVYERAVNVENDSVYGHLPAS